jgi:O-antigen/teichoic acid export membrane protein
VASIGVARHRTPDSPRAAQDQADQERLEVAGARRGGKVIRFTGHIQAAKAFFLPKLHRVAEFLVSQGITIAANLLYGLLCIRLLPVGEYAKFVVVFAIQGSLMVLLDVGISGTFIPLVGERIEDRQLIADYLASLRQIAHWLFAIAAPITVVAYPLLVRNRHWSWQIVAAMIAIVLVSAWFARVGSTYGSVLILQRDRGRWYRAQIVSGLGALALLGIFYGLHWFGAFTAILIGVAKIIWVALIYYLRARELLGVKGTPSKEKRTAIIQLTLPAVPSVVYYALSGQISVFLITIFGRTAAVASVGALSRLGQIFTLLSPMNALLVEPYFARLPRERLKSHYLLAFVAAGACGAGMVALAHIFPGLFLWVLGPKYAGLRTEVVLVILAGAIGLVGGVVASVNGSRRFTYYSFVLADNIITLIVQIIFIWKVDLSTVKAVLWFNIATITPTFFIGILAAFYGFAKGGRRIAGIDYSLEGS